MERRQGNATTTAGPCIALLQERFRQLKRQREEREERQLLDMFSGNKRLLFPSKLKKQSFEATGFSFSKDELILPTTASFEDPLSLELNNLTSNHMDYTDIRNQSLWQADNRVVNATVHKFDAREVDTSLHL